MSMWTARMWELMKMAMTDGMKLWRELDVETYILAYGSNLSSQRMAQRCPDMQIIGTTVIPGYRMLFKQSRTGAYATIEQDANCCVPALVYKISAEDEARLDRCEGYPRYYYKREFLLPVRTLEGRKLRKRRSCIAYILHEDRLLGEPSEDYYSIVESGYQAWDFDLAVLEKALSDSIGTKAAIKWLAAYRKNKKEIDEHE